LPGSVLWQPAAERAVQAVGHAGKEVSRSRHTESEWGIRSIPGDAASDGAFTPIMAGATIIQDDVEN